MNSKKRKTTHITIHTTEESEETQEKWQEASASLTRSSISSSSSSNQQQWIMELPSHVSMEILSRLPIKTLIKCRCVCKTWKTLLSDPHFIKLQLSTTPMNLLYKTLPSQNQSRQLFLIDLRDAKTYCSGDSKLKLTMKANLPPANRNGPMALLNSCNGLLCLGDCHTLEPLYVCNPILGEYIVLPRPQNGMICSGGIFGFCSETNQYKVVRELHQATSRWYDSPYEKEIYTLGEGIWRSIGITPYGFGTSTSFNTVLNGALHWVAFGGDDFIRSFHFSTEQFQVIPAPAVYGQAEQLTKDFLRLGVLDGCLFILSNGADSEKLEIWVMNEYGVQESWSKKFVINNLISKRHDFHDMDYFEPIMIMDSGEMLIIFNANSVVFYSPRMESFGLGYEVRSSRFQAIAHVPSFLSLKGVAMAEIFKVHHLYKSMYSFK